MCYKRRSFDPLFENLLMICGERTRSMLVEQYSSYEQETRGIRCCAVHAPPFYYKTISFRGVCSLWVIKWTLALKEHHTLGNTITDVILNNALCSVPILNTTNDPFLHHRGVKISALLSWVALCLMHTCCQFVTTIASSDEPWGQVPPGRPSWWVINNRPTRCV